MKRKVLIAVSLLVFVTAVLVVVAEARRPKKEVLGLPVLHIDPGTIYIDKDNDVTMTLSVDKKLRNPMVQYRDAQGTWQKFGVLKDDGKSGDVKKKDKTYTLKAVIPAKGSVEYRATAKKGLRTLLVSPVTTLEMRRGDWVIHQPLGNTGITIDYPVGMRKNISNGSDQENYFFESAAGEGFSVSVETGKNLLAPTVEGYIGKPVAPENQMMLSGVLCQRLQHSLFCIKNGVAYTVTNGYGAGTDPSQANGVSQGVFDNVLNSITLP